MAWRLQRRFAASTAARSPLTATSLRSAASRLSRRPQRRVPTAQLLLRDPAAGALLLGEHGPGGFFPGRVTGLCARMDDGARPEDVLLVAARNHGLPLEHQQLERRAVLEFLEADRPDEIAEDWVVYAEVAPRLEKSLPSLAATEDWRPFWAPQDAIPYHRMPVDDAIWYPPFLEGKQLGGRFAMDRRRLVSCALWELSPREVGKIQARGK